MSILRTIGFRLEAAFVWSVLRGVGLLPPVWASRFVGAVAAGIGPLLPVSNVADKNLQLAFPSMDRASRKAVIRQTWRHLGCTMGEYPHLPHLKETPSGAGWEIDPTSRAILHNCAEKGGPVILFSGHIGNWEMLPTICAAHGIMMSSAYRPPANPFIDRMLAKLRSRAMRGDVPMFPKGRAGAKGALGHLAKGGYLGLLIDQKMNDGIESILFGHKAMTAPALAAFALRYHCPVIPGYIVRIGPARVRLMVEPSLSLPDTGDRHEDVAILTRQVNECLERWITANPADWLWFHRRWPKELYKKI